MNTTNVNIMNLLLGGSLPTTNGSAMNGSAIKGSAMSGNAMSGIIPGLMAGNDVSEDESLLLGLTSEGSPLDIKPPMAGFDVVLGKLIDQPLETAPVFDLPSLLGDTVEGEAKTIMAGSVKVADDPLFIVEPKAASTFLKVAPTDLLSESVVTEIEKRTIPNDAESSIQTGVRPANDFVEAEEPFMVLPRSAVVQPELTSIPLGLERPPLPDGQYVVQNWVVEGETVHLDVALPGKPDSLVRLSIPLDQLATANTTTSAQTATINRQPRIMLDGTKQNNLTDLLSRYDIKEVHLASIAEASKRPIQSTSENDTTIKIIAQNTGQELVIKANLSRYALSTTDAPGAIRKQLESSDIEFENRTQSATMKSTTAPRPVLTSIPPTLAGNAVIERINSEPGMNQFAKTIEVLSPTLSQPVDESLNVLPTFARTTTDLTLPYERVDLQPVRFVVPENLQARLKPNGQSIRLLIEPDNLGPARLSLHLQNNRLRAVLVVDSAQAKMAVEGSLERLLTALEKADIEVDRIDVNVGQENSREQLFRQHPRAAFKTQAGRPFLIDDELENGIEHQAVTPTPEPSYVGSGGVNVLA